MIRKFKGEYRWLSNFAYVPIKLRGVIYRSVEHAYMSEKSWDVNWKTLCETTIKPGEVKKASRNIELRPDWEDVKLLVMDYCLREKFKQEPFKSLLIATGDEYLQEGNTWGDVFWGVDLSTGKGENNLGKLIMKIRDEIDVKI